MAIQTAAHDSFSPLNLSDQLVGESMAMIQLKRAAQRVAPCQTTIMIVGDPGTGKEMLARYVHQNSPRAGKPFVPVDCSSLSDTLLEGELFGHLKNAFPGATRDSLGFIRAADGGTLFLDSIGELALSIQDKLLGVLRNKVITSMGASRSLPVDVRLIASTTRDLGPMVDHGQFRQDLFAELNFAILKTPPLRDRRADIIPLAEHFLAVQADLHREPLKRLSNIVADVLEAYSWPGNLRELANEMDQAHVMATSDTIELSDISLRMQTTSLKPEVLPESMTLDDNERSIIVGALKRANYNKSLASQMLGINVQRLSRRIRRLGLPGMAAKV
jgi:DNA-binding NtrC family response regulator